MSIPESKKSLAAGIVGFLKSSLQDGTVSTEDQDSIEVSIQCIQEVFQTDSATPPKMSLEQIYNVFEKTQSKMSHSTSSTSASSSTAAPSKSPTNAPATEDPTSAQIEQAERHKSAGNQAMSQKDYAKAIAEYTSALALHPSQKIYLSNRAAAYSSASLHDSAIADATKATVIDPTYGKAWSRLGHAYFAKGDLEGARNAYERGVAVDPTSEIMKRGLDTATRKIAESSPTTTSSRSAGASGNAGAASGGGGMPDLSALAGMFGGGGGSGGGMPDLASITSNPQFMSMAQNLMSSGALDGLLQNPRMAEMARGLMGGQAPDLSQIMNDPDLRGMAENFGRNLGGGSGAGGARPDDTDDP